VRVTVVLPTYNERDTLPVLLRRLGEVASRDRLDCEAVVVDDSSPDGTAEAARRAGVELRHTLPVTVVSRPGKAGLASAVLEGVRRGRGDVIVIMDSDLSHPPDVLPRLLDAIAAGADIAVGSRYASGGGIDRWPAARRMLSWGATWLARFLLRVPVRDPMSGFFAARREVFEGMQFEGRGYKLLLEILTRQTAVRVREVPYRFTDRAGGRSKLGASEVLTFVRLLGRLWRAQAVSRTGRVLR
jgi:dolichol-phosphate mannosyltransferase